MNSVHICVLDRDDGAFFEAGLMICIAVLGRLTRMGAASGAFKRIGLEIAGWVLTLGGIAALILPGPGLLMILAGLVLLSQRYDWARRRLEPVKKQALKTAADSVATWPRIAASSLGAAVLLGLGVFWGAGPATAPSWWPLKDSWWLVGGWGTGSSLILAGVIAAALIVYSFRTFRESDTTARTP